MASYYAVLSNRDHITVKGKKSPIWEYLEVQPDGWLTSLVYEKGWTKPENTAMIFDCGAWSYREYKVPQIGKFLVTPQWVAERYQAIAKTGDIVVAPDHMLLPMFTDNELDNRRAFNEQSAKEFLKVCPKHLHPMAVVHGLTLEEKIKSAHKLVKLGYEAIALGGLAGQASRRQMIVETVTTLRQEVSEVWLHVLGISAPSYADIWYKIGIDSFDGASFYKQAFGSGKFIVAQKDNTIKSYKAAYAHEQVTIPACNCFVCKTLRRNGFETRQYGNGINNMGRAVHNLNQQIKVLKNLEMRYNGNGHK